MAKRSRASQKEIDDAIRAQLERIAHSTLLGAANIPAIALAEKLIEWTPSHLTRVFYSDSGAEAVEIALKIAFQYWRNIGEHKNKICHIDKWLSRRYSRRH